MKFAQTTAHAMLDAIETDLGASPIMYIRSGAEPATCAAADVGVTIATIPLAADAFTNAAAWAKAIPALVSDAAADNGGTMSHFRLKTGAGVTKIQGSITLSGGGGDMISENLTVNAGQQIDLASLSIGFPVAQQG